RPDIVHFAGHGSSDDAIVLESREGESEPVESEDLAELFRLQGQTVKLVLLNACYSQAQAEALIRHVPCAIGMNSAIPDEMAIAFASTFYQGLVQRESIQTAFNTSLLQIGRFRGSAVREDPRDLRPTKSSAPRVIPELLRGVGVDPASLKLVDGELQDRPELD